MLASSIKVNPGDIGYSGYVKNASNGTISAVMSTVYWAAGIVAVLVIIVAGFIFITSKGDANKIAQAKNAILYAVIGLVVVLVAFIITQLVLAGLQQ